MHVYVCVRVYEKYMEKNMLIDLILIYKMEFFVLYHLLILFYKNTKENKYSSTQTQTCIYLCLCLCLCSEKFIQKYKTSATNQHIYVYKYVDIHKYV